MTFSDTESSFMRRALALAGRARGDVEPNPLVGAVLVKNDKIIAEGYHRSFGGPHAEVHALAAAGKAAKGATLYVTLEPCCHHGKTPPCTDAILSSGVSRVVVAVQDPFPKVAGKGIRLLRKAGITVDVGLLEAQARTLNAPFFKRVTTGLPYVIAKWAQTLDGRIATASGESKWISSEASRAQVQLLRGRVDAIAVGIGTALADDPLLIARDLSEKTDKAARKAQTAESSFPYVGGGRLATRIVFDSDCRLPLTSQLVGTVAHAPVLLFCADKLSRPATARASALTGAGVTLVPIPTIENRKLKIENLSIRHALARLAELEYTNILLEGGPTLLASFFAAGQVDECHIYLAPTLLGGANSKPAIAGPDPLRLAHAHKLSITSIERTGPDLHITAITLR